jgi:hypothetical protein
VKYDDGIRDIEPAVFHDRDIRRRISRRTLELALAGQEKLERVAAAAEAREEGRRRARRANEANRRAVIAVETGERFPSILAASEAKGMSRSAVGEALRRGIRTAGTHWKYEDGLTEYRPRASTKDHRVAVVCVETGHRYESYREAAAMLDLPHKSIHNAVKRGGRCGGRRWMTAKQYDAAKQEAA